MKRFQKITISVVGAHKCDGRTEKLAYAVGKMVAELGAVLVCGGLEGVMAAACKGAKEAGGLTIGILPRERKSDANAYVDIALPTTIGFSRNVIVAASADIIVALPGSYGTESEICYARVYDRPVINLGKWKIKGLIQVKGLEHARKILSRMVEELKGHPPADPAMPAEEPAGLDRRPSVPALARANSHARTSGS